MDFYDVLAKVAKLLQREGRASYRALKRQFNLDDDYLDDLKDAILYAHPVTDDGRGLVWTGAPAQLETGDRHGGESEGRFQASLLAVMTMLQRDGRVTYRTLKHAFSISDALLAEIREELRLRRLAIDEENKVLVWIGATPSSMQPWEAAPSQPNTDASAQISPASSAPQAHLTKTDTTTHGPPALPEEAPTEPPFDGQHTAPKPLHGGN